MRTAGLVVAALVLTLVLMPAALALLRRLRALDHPNERSSHSLPTLRGGGIAPCCAAITVLATAHALGRPVSGAVLATGVAFAVLGLVEDLRGVPTGHRFAFQVLLAVAAVVVLDPTGGPWPWGPALAVLAVVWIAAYVNAFNFMDGINGISGVQAVVAGTGLALMAVRAEEPVLALHAAVVAAVALGFLPFNFPRARVFLGDAGSYFFGASIAGLVILGLRAGLPPEAALAPVVLYLADTGTTLAKRMLRGASWHRPHREHVYQRLTQLGWSHTRVSLVVAALIAAHTALGSMTIDASPPSRAIAIGGLLALTGGYLLMPAWVARRDPRAAGSSVASP